jgi:hypothetical protein
MTMNIHSATPIVTLLACLCLAAPAHAASSADDLTALMSQGGLHKIKVNGIELAYARPGATLAGYDKVKLDPVQVTFAKNWNPTPTGSVFPISPSQRETIRKNVARIVYQAFVKELQRGNGYPVVTKAGPHVLGIKVYVINVTVTVPGVMTPGMSQTFSVSSAGQGTLVLQLYDSQSYKILARAMDAQAAQNLGPMMITNSVTNQAAGERIAYGWAQILRKELDAAHDIGKK